MPFQILPQQEIHRYKIVGAITLNTKQTKFQATPSVAFMLSETPSLFRSKATSTLPHSSEHTLPQEGTIEGEDPAKLRVRKQNLPEEKMKLLHRPATIAKSFEP